MLVASTSLANDPSGWRSVRTCSLCTSCGAAGALAPAGSDLASEGVLSSGLAGSCAPLVLESVVASCPPQAARAASSTAFAQPPRAELILMTIINNSSGLTRGLSIPARGAIASHFELLWPGAALALCPAG